MVAGSGFSDYCLRTMKSNVFIIISLMFLLGTGGFVYAADADGSGQTLPVPRFVTLGTDEVNVRTGPGIRYPIRFIFKKDGLPVEIIKEFDVWRQIRDMEGNTGWVHQSLLSGKRAVIVKGHMQTLFKKPVETARPVVQLEPGVIAGLDRCDEEWCYLSVASYKGWLRRENVWGVYADEK